MKITTKDGFTCELNEEALGDWEILEQMIEAQKGQVTLLPGIMQELIGADGYAAAKEHCRNEKGRVPTTEIERLFFEILTSVKNDGPEDKKK